MTKPLELYTFGGLTIRRGDTPIESDLAQKGRAMLVYLACNRRSHRRETLANLLWDKGDDRHLMSNLRVLLTGLRRSLAPYLTITRESVAFDPTSPHWLDVTEIEQGLAAARAQRNPSGALPAAGMDQLDQTLQLYRGDFLRGFNLRGGQGFAEWQVVEQERWRLQVLDGLRELVAAALALGNYQLGLAQVTRWLELDPLNEHAHRQAMRLYAYSHHWDSALQQYDQCRQTLAAELGIQPAAETTTLYQAIKTKSLPPAVQPPVVGRYSVAARLPQTAVSVFVGRARQLAELSSALDDARNGGRLRFVIGGAGRGKSMLLQEFSRQAQALDPQLLVVFGYGHDQTGQGTPYLPWREMLAMLTGDVEAGPATEPRPKWQTQRLRAAMPLTLPLLITHAPGLIQSLLPGRSLQQRAATITAPNADWFQQLNALAAVDSPPKLAQKDIFGQVTALLKAIAAQQPLLLILEDLHWANPASCGLLFHLNRHLGDSPILLVGSYRPEEISRDQGDGRHPLLGLVDELKRQHGDIWLDLGQIGEAEGRQFVADYLDSQPNRLDEQFRGDLYRQTGGHPLFTVELVQGMQERGELTRDKTGCWTVGDSVDWQRLPARVEGVIESRFHHLDEALQTTLTIASVEGERFTAEVIARMQGVEAQSVVRQLSRALDKQQRLVTPLGLERLEPGGQRLSCYRFRHNLFQRYLYQNLDELERTYLHEAVGNALESFYGEQAGQAAVQLAYHFQQAGVTGKAVAYLLQAGQQAVKLGAYVEAMAHLIQGLHLLKALPDSSQRDQQELMLQIILGHVLIATRGYGDPAVRETFDRARTLYLQVGETPQLLSVLFGLISFYMLGGGLPVALELGQQFLRQAREQADSVALLVGYRSLGDILLFMGRLPQARSHLEESVALYNPEQPQTSPSYLQSSGAAAVVNYAFTLWLLGYPDQARRQALEAVRLVEVEAEANLGPINMAVVLTFTAIIFDFRRDRSEARRYAEAALAVAEQHGLPIWLAMSSIVRNAARVKQGQVGPEIVDQMHQSLAVFNAAGMVVGVPYMHSLLAEILEQFGQTGAGLTQLDEALVVVAQTEHRTWEPELYRLKGELLARQGASSAKVETCFQQAIDIAGRQEARSLELRATLSLCRLWQSQGKTEKAHQRLADIYHWFSEGFDTRDLIEAGGLLESLAEQEIRNALQVT